MRIIAHMYVMVLIQLAQEVTITVRATYVVVHPGYMHILVHYRI